MLDSRWEKQSMLATELGVDKHSYFSILPNIEVDNNGEITCLPHPPVSPSPSTVMYDRYNSHHFIRDAIGGHGNSIIHLYFSVIYFNSVAEGPEDTPLLGD